MTQKRLLLCMLSTASSLCSINGDVFTGNEKAYDTERYISDKVYKKGIFFEVCSFDMFLDEPRPVLSYLMDLLNASSQFQQVSTFCIELDLNSVTVLLHGAQHICVDCAVAHTQT